MSAGDRGGRALLVAVLLLAVGAAVGFVVWRRQLALQLAGEPSDPSAPAVTPELAESTLDKVEGLRSGAGRQQLALGDAELSSVVRYALPGILPPGVSEPEVHIHGETVALSAHVTRAAFPDLPALGDVVGMLPDTVPVRIRGRLERYGKESLAFFVSDVEAAAIPLPDRLIPQVLAALGRQARKGLPGNALHIPLPGGLDSVYVARDSLVLVSDK